MSFIVGLGAIFFGITIGWIAYRILRFRVGVPGLSDLIALLGAIGGAAVLVFKDEGSFGWYSIGLVIGFFAYFAVGLRLFGKQEVQPWRLEQIPPTSTPDTQSSTPSTQSDTHED
jgi:hypothetical protein